VSLHEWFRPTAGRASAAVQSGPHLRGPSSRSQVVTWLRDSCFAGGACRGAGRDRADPPNAPLDLVPRWADLHVETRAGVSARTGTIRTNA
jgi:hypothetical protein